MPVLKARYDRTQEVITVDGGGRLSVGESGGLVGSRMRVADLSLSSLRAAVSRADYSLGLGDEVQVTIYDAPEQHLVEEEDAFLAGAVDLEVHSDRVLVICTTVAELGQRFDQCEITAQLAPALSRHNLLTVALNVYEERFQTVAHLSCEVGSRGRTVGDALLAGENVLALWEATMGDGLSLSTATDLLQAGRPELLVGQVESDWLEAKGAPYRLDDVSQESELSKDVAAMANGATGGIIVVGLATRRRGERDVISKIRLVPVELLDCARYRRVIDKTLYPPLVGMTVEVVRAEWEVGRDR